MGEGLGGGDAAMRKRITAEVRRILLEAMDD
jgi:hypothetical protein